MSRQLFAIPLDLAEANAFIRRWHRHHGDVVLASEHGASLKAAGWRSIGETKGGSWSRNSRPRVDTHPTEPKLLFEAVREGAER